MSHGPISVFSVSVASNATTSSEADLARAWKKVYLDPTGAGAEVRLWASDTSGGTLRQVYLPQPATSTVQANIWKVGSAVSGGLIEIAGGIRFMKFTVTATAADGATLKVYCSD